MTNSIYFDPDTGAPKTHDYVKTRPRATHRLYRDLKEAAYDIPVPSHCFTMAKPSGSVCNLDCVYCFYLEKEKLYPERQRDWRMNDDTLSRYIAQQIDAQQGDEVVFSWQGGEPTLLGVAFYRRAFELQQQYAANRSVNIVNTFQTNGINIDESWALLFKEHQVLVGISIDGPQHLHDAYRVKRNGEPTFEKVMAAISILKRHHVSFNTLTVVHDINGDHPEAVYEFLVSIGSEYLQFIPLIERAALSQQGGLTLVQPEVSHADVTSWSVGEHQFGDFLCRVFDVWVARDVGKVFVQMFDSTLASHLGYPATLCSHAAQCGSNFAIEANGDVYACDHYVYPEHFLGSIHEESLTSINEGVANRAFGLSKSANLAKKCLECQWRFACHGGCPKHRFKIDSESQSGRHYLCASYAAYFAHTAIKMAQMVSLIVRGKPPFLIMK
ncbi:anaerobic sulfatase maturase [Enterovibrio makurazakiensis]|uniref:anaerobic sulfatase maturase n=1 Tax=Enterovibrio makurazakiensis TaxID=2910232 RepID=UPI003D220D93